MIELLRELLTGKDNKTHDIARWSWFTTTLSVIAGGFWNALHTNSVNLTDFAQAIGIITGAHGAAVMMKKDTEPDDTKSNS